MKRDRPRCLVRPVVVANTTEAANMGLVGATNGTDQGTATGQTQVALTPVGSLHPTGGGLTAGTTPTSSVAESIGWAKPAGSAVNTATLTGDVSKATVFSYEAGSAMITGTAPARRVGFFPTNGTVNATGQVAQLFDAAVGWEANTPVVSYVRDALDRIVARKINGTIVAKNSFTATGDTADITLDPAGNVVEAITVLTGGALWTAHPGATDVWSYPNIHGDLVATANSTGVKQGATRVFDPYGNPLGGSTVPDNSAGGMDYGWHGSQQRPHENQPGVLPVIEMGARQYSPALGRFLEVDPIEGGVDNDYVYPTDPVNSSGLCGVWGNPWKKCGKKHKGATSLGNWIGARFTGIRAFFSRQYECATQMYCAGKAKQEQVLITKATHHVQHNTWATGCVYLCVSTNLGGKVQFGGLAAARGAFPKAGVGGSVGYLSPYVEGPTIGGCYWLCAGASVTSGQVNYLGLGTPGVFGAP